jgi:filamentous hemagglutinin family protein
MNGRRAKQQRRHAGHGPQGTSPATARIVWKDRLTAAGVLTGALIPFMPTPAFALPQGGTVAAGTATISTPTATSMRIEQASDRAILDWTRFNIAANESVRFQQPSAASIALNRVSGQEPSAIFGSLSANGQIFLLNPSGILFGVSSRVDVGALTASTLTMTNQDFLNRQYRFTQDPSAANAAVVNQGVITAGPGGYVALLGAAAHNEGVIQAQLGSIALASGKAATLDMRGDGLIQFVITEAVSGSVNGLEGQPLASYVSNTGTLQADGGMITLQAKAAAGLVRSVVNQEGLVRATSLVNHGGVIMLVAEGDTSIVWNAGTLDVSAQEANATPGYIAISGALAGQAGTILARGADSAAGGHVDITSTQQTELFAGSVVDVSGTGHSDGGSVRVWSDKNTSGAAGAHILARGGDSGGNGGFVEVSGKERLAFAGSVDASAPLGQGGIWLLDPNDITIQAAGIDTNVTASPTFTSTDDTAIVTTGSIQTALNAGTSVTVTTASAGANTQSGNITVADSISKTAGGDATLTLSANNDITVNAGVAISSTTGKLHVVLAADSDGSGAGAIVLTGGSSITSLGGNITLGGGTNPGGLVNGALPATGATGNATNIAGISSGAILNAGGGNIWLMGTGYAGAAGGDVGVTLLSGSNLQTSGTGTITLTGNGGGTGGNNNWGVNLFGTTVQTSGSGLITVTGTAGSVGSGTDNYGVVLQSSSTIQTTGTGDITVWGHGGNTTSGVRNSGIFVVNGSTVHAIGTGIITLTGFSGNNGVVSSDQNQGVDVQGLVAGGGSPIFITGTGGNSFGFFNFGIRVRGTISNIGAGAITMVASGGGNPASLGTGNFGLGLSRGTISAVNGTITITGTGGNSGGTGNDGVRPNSGSGFGLNRIQTSGSGNIIITGIAGPGGLGINSTLFNSNVVQTTGTGSITLITDSISFAIVNTINSVTDLILRPYTNGTSIGVGTAAGGGLNISDTNLGFMNWGSSNYLTLGASTAGALTINTGYSFPKPVTFISGSASDIMIAGQLTSSSSGAGTPNTAAVVLDAGRNFINTVGASAIIDGSGRWLIYSTNPASDTRGGLVYNFKQYNATYGITTVLGAGNGFLYTIAPSITASLIGTATMVYDGTMTATLAAGNYAVSGAIDGDTVTLNDPASGTYNTRNIGINKNVSVSGLTIASATNGAATVYGYQLASTTANANIGVITARSLTVTAQSDTKVYDGTTSSAVAPIITSGTLAAGDTSAFLETFNTQNVGVGKTLTASGAVVDGNSGNNYAVSFVTDTTGVITGASVIVNGEIVTVGLPGNVQYLLSSLQNEDAQLLTAGVLPEGVYTCLNMEAETVACNAIAMWNEDNLGGITLTQRNGHDRITSI